MANIDLSGFNIDQLTELIGKAQSEMASRERKRRKSGSRKSSIRAGQTGQNIVKSMD